MQRDKKQYIKSVMSVESLIVSSGEDLRISFSKQVFPNSYWYTNQHLGKLVSFKYQTNMDKMLNPIEEC